MARSNRSKAKKVNKRAKQAEGSVFQVADAARLERLSARLAAKLREPPPLHPIGDQDEEAEEEDIMDEEGVGKQSEFEKLNPSAEVMEVDSIPKKISTSGRRLSRRAEWRQAKGLPTLKRGKTLNRQGIAKGTRKSGRPARRR